MGLERTFYRECDWRSTFHSRVCPPFYLSCIFLKKCSLQRFLVWLHSFHQWTLPWIWARCGHRSYSVCELIDSFQAHHTVRMEPISYLQHSTLPLISSQVEIMVRASFLDPSGNLYPVVLTIIHDSTGMNQDCIVFLTMCDLMLIRLHRQH